jgi:Ca2+-binding EF-hand superfamily protein
MKTSIKNIIVGTLIIAIGGLSTSMARPARLTGLLKQYDIDDNGKLDEEERLAAKDDLTKKYEEFLAEWDKDGDGKLSRTEIAAFRKSVREKIQANRLAKFLEVAGEDELISPAEFAAMPAFAGLDAAKVTKLFNALDRDKSGQMTFAEFLRSFRTHR